MRTGSHLEYGGEGGIDSLRSPLRGSPLAGSRSVQLAAPVVEPRSGVLIPPVENIKEKSPYLRTGSHLEYGGEGGLTRFARPCGAARSQARGLSNWRCQLSNPGRGFSSPPAENIKEKSPYLRTGSHLEYGGEGGIDSLRSPLRGSSLAGSRSVQLAAPVVEPRSGVLIPPRRVPHAKKKPVLAYELFLKYGGEGGIRTPDTLPYTHFPGVLLQPLGHLTILSCCSPWVGNGALL